MKSRPVVKIVTSDEYVFTFGKYKGKTVRDILDSDPGYIVWLDDKKIMKFSDQIYQEAEQLDYETPRDYGDINDMYWFMDEPF